MDQSQASPRHVPEKYLIAFVIQGEDVFKITADNIIHTTGTADGPAFDAIAKLKAAAALLELTNRHKERPDELRKMARELAGEGMKLMAVASSSIRPMPAAVTETQVDEKKSEAPRSESVRSESSQPPHFQEPAQVSGQDREADTAPVRISPRIALISS